MTITEPRPTTSEPGPEHFNQQPNASEKKEKKRGAPKVIAGLAAVGTLAVGAIGFNALRGGEDPSPDTSRPPVATGEQTPGGEAVVDGTYDNKDRESLEARGLIDPADIPQFEGAANKPVAEVLGVTHPSAVKRLETLTPEVVKTAANDGSLPRLVEIHVDQLGGDNQADKLAQVTSATVTAVIGAAIKDKELIEGIRNGMPDEDIEAAIRKYTTPLASGLFGEKQVNNDYLTSTVFNAVLAKKAMEYPSIDGSAGSVDLPPYLLTWRLMPDKDQSNAFGGVITNGTLEVKEYGWAPRYALGLKPEGAQQFSQTDVVKYSPTPDNNNVRVDFVSATPIREKQSHPGDNAGSIIGSPLVRR